MNISKIKTSLHSRLSSRRVHYDCFVFVDGSVVVITYMQGQRASMSLPYTIKPTSDGNIILSSFDKSNEVKSEQTAVSLIINDLKRKMGRFKQYLS